MDTVVDDAGNSQSWIMAPKPGYRLPFDIRGDELVIMKSALGEVANAGFIVAEFWNVGGDKFNTNTCTMTLIDAETDTYWDSFTITEDVENCKDYGGKQGLIQYILREDKYTNIQFEDTNEIWQLATFDEMYATVDNGGVFPWDGEPPTTWSFW
mgnify:CR=1 FL=1